MKRGRRPYDDILTPREWQVVALLREGLTYEQIARRLDISFGGAKYHITQIFSKLGVGSREDALQALDRRRGLPAFLPAAFLRLPVLASAAVVVLLAAGITAFFVFGRSGDTSEPAAAPGPIVLTPDRPLDLPQVAVTLDERYDPAEFETLIPLLQRHLSAVCTPDCVPDENDRAGMRLLRPDDGSVAADIRLDTSGIVALTRASADELLIASGPGPDSVLLVLDARNGFSVKQALPLPYLGSYHFYQATDFTLSNDQRFLYYRMETPHASPSCAVDNGVYHCVAVLNLETGEIRQATIENGCGSRIRATGESDAIITCYSVVLKVDPLGRTLASERIEYFEKPNPASPLALSSVFGFEMPDGRLATLSGQGVLVYRDASGTQVYEPLLPEGLRLWTPAELPDGRVLFNVERVPGGADWDAVGQAYLFDPEALTMTLAYDYGHAAFVRPIPGRHEIAVLRFDGSLHLASPDGSTRLLVEAPPPSRANDLTLVP